MSTYKFLLFFDNQWLLAIDNIGFRVKKNNKAYITYRCSEALFQSETKLKTHMQLQHYLL